ncbi:hypothetical protein ACI798_02205 [Geodermatophilus sp. SYSU D01045]
MTRPPPGQPWQPPQGPLPGFLPPPPEEKETPVYLRPWFAVLALVLVVGTIGAALGGGDDDEPATVAASTTTVTETVTATPSPQPAVPPVSSAPPPAVAPSTTATLTTSAAPVVDFAMPSVVGMTLQDAQDLIQTHGVFLSLSHDLLDTRNQVLDANWKVCTQNVPAGQRVTGDVEGAIDLGVVKLEESCP